MKIISDKAHAMETGKTTSPPGVRRIVIGAALVVVVGIGWYLFRPELLFVNHQVNEAFPAPSLVESASSGAIDTKTLASGVFHKGAHETKGTATIHQLADGARVLRLTDFETSNGPDVHVYLIASDDATDGETVKSGGFVDLGSLKGNVGDQNYSIPADVDLAKYRAVTIWCARFGVNFGTAGLRRPGTMGASNEPTALVRGSFHNGAHETKGTATIFRLADGRRVLRLTDFETSNGPDVRVYLVAATDALDSETVKSAGHIELGRLKGNVGDQNYDIPADVDLDTHRAVTIWCARFGVNFGTAPLN